MACCACWKLCALRQPRTETGHRSPHEGIMAVGFRYSLRALQTSFHRRKADQVRFAPERRFQAIVPRPVHVTGRHDRPHSITSSAAMSIEGGTASPSDLAVLILTSNSNLVA